ncbi:hypothetical protein KEM54_000849 [Ascosphaera aggregata]|nr:hypothetical protein KEM54_000849 [Ascosphaera aggregata]
MEFLLLKPAHVAVVTAAKKHSRSAVSSAAASVSVSASTAVAAAAAATSRPSSLVPAQCATHVPGVPFVQRRSFRSTPFIRREDGGGTAHHVISGEVNVNPPLETEQSSKRKPKRMRYRIAAAASGKTSGVSLDRNVYPFLPQYHDAIGIQRLSSDPAKRRSSRPDSGEDAFFVSKVGIGRAIANANGSQNDNHNEHEGSDADIDHAIAFGVADGVGGWANSGVDPADFSHALCTYMADSAMEWKQRSSHQRLSGRKLIQMAYDKSLRDKTIFAGGSTASIGLAWESGELELTNLGDSGSMLFRNAAIHHYSPPQTHDFNTPYQLTVMPPRVRSQTAIFGGRPFDDLPNAADVTTWEMQHGDVVLLATDGVFDNLFRSDLLRVVTSRMFTAGAWKMDDANGTQVADGLEKVTQPGGINIEALSRNTKHDGSSSSGEIRNDSADVSGGAEKDTNPFANLDPLMKPSLQSLLALSIVVQAKLASLNMRRDGPFAKEAQRYRPAERWRGGKIDDTTALVVIAVEEGKDCI